jgi:hypothetical protein
MAAVGVMLVPRPSNQKLAVWVGRLCYLVFKAVSMRARNYHQLDRLLAVQGPTTVLLYLALFLGIFLTAFAFLFYGATGCSPMAAFYRAGSGMSTLGMVDISGAPGYIAMFVAAFTGTTVVSVFIGFLLTLYTAYTARETHMSKLAMICGEPGWGPEMTVRLHTLQVGWTPDALDQSTNWVCAMRVSQYLYPLLNHFRSPVRDRHWTVSLLALLDAAAIRLTCLCGGRDLNVLRLLAQGADTFHALKLSEVARTSGGVSEGAMLTWVIEEKLLADADDGPVPDPGITRDEWDKAMDFMAAQGVDGARSAGSAAITSSRLIFSRTTFRQSMPRGRDSATGPTSSRWSTRALRASILLRRGLEPRDPLQPRCPKRAAMAAPMACDRSPRTAGRTFRFSRCFGQRYGMAVSRTRRR